MRRAGGTTAQPFQRQTLPTGAVYWINTNDPTRGYLEDPTGKQLGSVRDYPIEYINWLLRPQAPTAAEVRVATGSPREIGGLALNGKIGVAYGRIRVAPSIMFGPRLYGGGTNAMVLGYGLSHGPCQGLVSTLMPNKSDEFSYGGAYVQQFYPGSLTPAAADAQMAFAAGVDPAVMERYPGLCYVRGMLTWDATKWAGTGVPLPLFTLDGRVLFDHRDGLYRWTQNDALILADYIESKQYGRGGKCNVASVQDAAQYCDELVLNSATAAYVPRHAMNYFLMRAAFHKSHQDAIRAHFRCNVIERGGEYVFRIDKLAASVMAFDETNTVPISLERFGGSTIPNSVTAWITDAAKDWTRAPTYARTSRVEAGTAIVESAEYELEGLTDNFYGVNESAYLLNSRLNNLRVVLRTTKLDARRLEPLDVITYTSPSLQLVNYQLRVLRVARSADGATFLLECTAYNPAIYVSIGAVVETLPVVNLPGLMDAPAVVTAPAWSEKVYAPQNGQPQSRVELTWTPPLSDPNYGRTLVTVQRPGEAERELGSYETGPAWIENTQDLATYMVRFYSVNRLSDRVRSAAVLLTFTTGNKTAVPGNVTNLWSSPMGTMLKLGWSPVTDLDVRGYETRSLPVAECTGTDATSVRADFARARLEKQDPSLHAVLFPPIGARRFFVVAYDSAFRYSDLPLTVDVTIAASGVGMGESALSYSPLVSFDPQNTDSWWGSGNAVMDGWRVAQTERFYLSRRMSPAAAETERATSAALAATGRTLVDWATLIDDPRRRGAPLWAPLDNDNESGQFLSVGGAGGTSRRNLKITIRMAAQTRYGISAPIAVPLAEPISSGQSGPQFFTPATGGTLSFGFKLSSNSRYAQNVLIAPAGAVMYMTQERIMVDTEGPVDLVTDALGLATYTLLRPFLAACTPDVTLKVIGTSGVIADVSAISNTAFTVRVVNGANVAVAGVLVRCTIRDAGIGGTSTVLIG